MSIPLYHQRSIPYKKIICLGYRYTLGQVADQQYLETSQGLKILEPRAGMLFITTKHFYACVHKMQFYAVMRSENIYSGAFYISVYRVTKKIYSHNIFV